MRCSLHTKLSLSNIVIRYPLYLETEKVRPPLYINGRRVLYGVIHEVADDVLQCTGAVTQAWGLYPTWYVPSND